MGKIKKEQLSKDINNTLEDVTDLKTHVANISNPNLLINGDFQVRQRGDTFSYGAFNPKYTFDRWFAFSGNASSGSVISENGEEYFRVKGTSIGQIIEYLEMGTYTVSAFVKTNLAQNFTISIDDTNGISDRSPIFIHKVDIDTTWTKISYTFTITTKTKSYFSVILGLTSTTETSQFDIEYVKLEIGDKATPFVPRPIGEELALCQRYYEVSNHNIINVKDNYRQPLQFKVIKRNVPTNTIENPYTNTVGKMGKWNGTTWTDYDISSYMSQSNTNADININNSTGDYIFALKSDSEIY